jgi:hypothetical protein
VDNEAMQEANAAVALANALLAQLFPALLAAFQSEVEEVSLPLVPFMTAYVNRLKNVQKRCAPLLLAVVAAGHGGGHGGGDGCGEEAGCCAGGGLAHLHLRLHPRRRRRSLVL